MGGVTRSLAETLRGGHASLRWLAGSPFVNARMARRARDRAEARAMIAEHFARFLERCGIRVVVEGTPPAPGTGCVLCYNETSFIDVAAFGSCMWPHVDRAAAADLYAWLPFGREAARRAGIEMVPRGNRAATGRLLDRMVGAVQAGERLAWGGEGRLQGRDAVGRFKLGASLIAIRAGAPVIPVVFHGGHQAMPLGSLRARPGTVQVRFGAPVPTTGYTEEDARTLTDHLQATATGIYAELKAAAAGGHAPAGPAAQP